jgi:uncharacterized protein
MNSYLLWTLISIQVAMGAFDTLYHHEFTERLAWRPSQGHELKLHAVRNFLYALIFVVLGWFEIYGLFAYALMAILAVEVIITLMDFVEEDLSRRLPATERINHTLLALNYGAILVLVLPMLFAWAQQETGFNVINYGLRSYFAVLSALGVAVFGLRDLLASYRSDRLLPAPAANLVSALPPRQRLLVTGATGFIGKRLCEALSLAGHDVTALVRNPKIASELQTPIEIVTSLDQIGEDRKFDVIINLAGAPIAAGRWTDNKKHSFIQSRLDVTEQVLGLVKRLGVKPEVLINGSAIGWYGLRGDEELTERDQSTDCFSHKLCAAWETCAAHATDLGLRTVYLRIGIVLGTQGGALTSMLTPFEFGLGGPMGNGKQWMSWITRDDLVRLMAHCITEKNISGPVNATAPNPVQNNAFVKSLAHGLRRPALFRVPAFVLRLLMGQLANELLLGGQRVLPAKAVASGFKFQNSEIDSAFNSILGNLQC